MVMITTAIAIMTISAIRITLIYRKDYIPFAYQLLLQSSCTFVCRWLSSYCDGIEISLVYRKDYIQFVYLLLLQSSS